MFRLRDLDTSRAHTGPPLPAAPSQRARIAGPDSPCEASLTRAPWTMPHHPRGPHALGADLRPRGRLPRAPRRLREDHLALARAAHERGELLLAGALADPYDRALLVFAGDGPGVAEAFAAADPYVTAGLVASWTVRQWNEVLESG